MGETKKYGVRLERPPFAPITTEDVFGPYTYEEVKQVLCESAALGPIVVDWDDEENAEDQYDLDHDARIH